LLLLDRGLHEDYKRSDEQAVEEEIAEFLKHAPHQPGGLKHKVRTMSVC